MRRKGLHRPGANLDNGDPACGAPADEGRNPPPRDHGRAWSKMRSPIPTRTLLLGLGLLAVMVAAFSAYDATRRKPTDGAVWHLQGKQIRVVGVTPGGPADRARPRP